VPKRLVIGVSRRWASVVPHREYAGESTDKHAGTSANGERLGHVHAAMVGRVTET